MPDRTLLEDRYYIRPKLDPANYKRIIYDPGLVTRIILNRPRYKNACSHALLAELEDAFDRAAQDPQCNVIVLSGNGDCFCSGDDAIGLTPESAPTLWDGDARPPAKLIEQYGSEAEVWHQYNIEHDYLVAWMVPYKLRAIPKPTIAMVHGYATFMGHMLASAMDVLFASEDALFLMSGDRIGQVNWLWFIGPRKAMELAYEHRCMTAREAQELGLVNRAFPSRELLEKETMAYAYRVADQSPAVLRRTKENYLNAMDHYGWTAAFEGERTPHQMRWRQWAEDGHRMRYEGKGMARIPVGLANLKAKLESEGKKVPQNVLDALAKAAARDDKGTWQKILHESWRDQSRKERADSSAKAYQDYKAAHEERKRAEQARRGLQ